MNDIGNSLSIGRRPRSTTIYSIVDMGKFVGDSVGLKAESGKRNHGDENDREQYLLTYQIDKSRR
jgi:hypothetical protein